jgi:protein gp37
VSEHTGIEWCDHTFNIAWGCMKVSPGCAHCYADTLSHRYGFEVWGPAKTTGRRTFGLKHWNEPLAWNRKAAKDGVRRRVFCSSMCDVFEDHPIIDAERTKLWPLIRATPHLDWLILTKRPERIAGNLPLDWGRGYANVWLGTSVESQEYLERAHDLVRVPARIHFLSVEPMLGPVYLEPVINAWHERGSGTLDWVIVGGESGPGARPMEEEWVRDIVRECVTSRIPVFLKQLGGHPDKRGHERAMLDGKRYVEWPAPSPGTRDGIP